MIYNYQNVYICIQDDNLISMQECESVGSGEYVTIHITPESEFRYSGKPQKKLIF